MQDKQFTDKKALMPFLKRMFRYSWRYRRWMGIFAFWTIVVGMVDGVFPLVLLGILDNAITPQLAGMQSASAQGIAFSPDFTMLWRYGGLLVLMSVVQVTGIFIFIKYAGRIQEYVLFHLRQDLFEKLQKLQFAFYDRSASGWLLTRISSDTDRVTELISWGLLDAIWGLAMIVFCFIAMLIYSWKLALVVLISIPVMLVVSVRIRLLVLKFSRESRKINSEITAAYSEHINGFEVVKSTAQEQRTSVDFGKLSGAMRQASYRSSYYTAMYLPLVILFGSLASAIVLYMGATMAVALPAGITVGLFIAAFEYATRIYQPIHDITRFYAMAQASLSAGERIFSLLDEPVQIRDKEGVSAYQDIRGDIVFKNVSFHYQSENPVLADFNLHIPAGQSVALVGATGDGKTTISSLICRFYEPVAGELLIDGVDYRERTLNSLRSRLGVVLQTPHLFSGTLRENLLFGKPEATEPEILEALQYAGAADFHTRLEDQVGENGDNLSVGEKQLIALARAILAQPRILIMDEATSSVDTLTESRIQQGIQHLLKGRTSVIIAHRLSTIKSCDRIIVIQKGKIAEDGSHQELMARRGIYYGLYTHQWKEEAVGAALVAAQISEEE